MARFHFTFDQKQEKEEEGEEMILTKLKTLRSTKILDRVKKTFLHLRKIITKIWIVRQIRFRLFTLRNKYRLYIKNKRTFKREYHLFMYDYYEPMRIYHANKYLKWRDLGR